jgi:transposase
LVSAQLIRLPKLIRVAEMAGALSVDLRLRVVRAIEDGLSTREAARRFAIGIATAGAWHRLWRRTGGVEPGRQGHPVRSKLDAHEDFILGLVEAQKDIALGEIAERLAAEKGVAVAPSTVWHFFRKRSITYKKRLRMLPNRSGRTSSGAARTGSIANSTSIRPG